MNYQNLILIYILEFTNLLHYNNGEYRVYSHKIPSYLYREFKTVNEDIFPADLNINMSLTKTDGMLLYSIDKHTNQLTVSLKNTIPAVFLIDLNGQKSYFTLPELCRCDHCLYEILNLQIYIRDSTMYLSCNDGDTKTVKFRPDKHLNKERPMPYNPSRMNTYDPNEAHIWLVNTPLFKDAYPQSDQLSGCIFNVIYNNQEIKFTKITDSIKRECTKTCIDDICNGGQCYETFKTVPLCNCTRTFKNGPYCNDIVANRNAKSVHQKTMIAAFKLSFKGSATEIMKLENKIVLLRLFVEDEILVMEYQQKQKQELLMKGLTGKNHEVDMEYIIVVTFKDTFMDIQVHYNASWYHRIIKTENDLSRELFDSLELRSGDGVIDLVIKPTLNDWTWTSIDMGNIEQLDAGSRQTKNTSNGSNSTTNRVNVVDRSFVIGFFVGIVPIVLVFIIVTVLLVKCMQRRRQQNNRTVVSKSDKESQTLNKSLLSEADSGVVSRSDKESPTLNKSLLSEADSGSNFSFDRYSIESYIQSFDNESRKLNGSPV